MRFRPSDKLRISIAVLIVKVRIFSELERVVGEFHLLDAVVTENGSKSILAPHSPKLPSRKKSSRSLALPPDAMVAFGDAENDHDLLTS